MPIYEYRCDGCADEFEVIQKFSDAPLATCTKCGGRLAKLLSRSGFSLKGAGWYADGYGKGSGGSGVKPSPKAGGNETSGSSSGESAKPPAKASSSD